MTFNEAIRRLTTVGCCNDVVISSQGSYVCLDSLTKQFLVTVTAEALSIAARFDAKEIERVANFR